MLLAAGGWFVGNMGTVPESDYDDVVTQLDATRADLEAANGALATATAELNTATTGLEAANRETTGSSNI